MKKIICFMSLVFLFNSSVAFAEDAKDKDTYFNLSGMVVNSDGLDPRGSNDLELNGTVTDNSKFGFSMALGKKLFKNFRVEAQYARRNIGINVKDKAAPEIGTVLKGKWSDLSAQEQTALSEGGEWTTKPVWNENTKTDADGISNIQGKLVGTFKPTTKEAIEVDTLLYEKHSLQMSSLYDNDNIIVQTLMANAFYDIHLDDLSPYVGVGIGMSFIDLEDETNFAYQFMGGVGYKITERVSSNIGVTFLDAGDVTKRIGNFDVETENTSLSLDLGVTITF